MVKKKEKKERQLTKQELERKALFEEKKEKLIQQGYVYKNLSLDVVYANIMAVVFALPFIVVLYSLFFVVNGDGDESFSLLQMYLFAIIILLLTVVHELIHGSVWGIFSKNHFKDISFGVIWSMLTPYCCCKNTLKKWQYILGGIMPMIVLGILPCIYAIVFCNFYVLLIGLLMVLGGGADLLICIKMIFYKSECKEVLFIDHPYECGFVVFEK